MLQLVMFATVHHGISTEVPADDEEEEIGEPKYVITKAAFEDTLLSCLRGHKKLSDREILNIADFALEEMRPEVTGTDFEGNYTMDCHQFVELSMALQGIPCDTFLDVMRLDKHKSCLEWMFTPPRMKALLGKQSAVGPPRASHSSIKGTRVGRATACRASSIQSITLPDDEDDESLSRAPATPKKASPKNRNSTTSDGTSEHKVDEAKLDKNWQDTKTQVDKIVSMLGGLDQRMAAMHRNQTGLELQIADAKTELREARERLKLSSHESATMIEEAMNTIRAEAPSLVISFAKTIQKDNQYENNYIQAEIKTLKKKVDNLTKDFDLNTTQTNEKLNEIRELANRNKEEDEVDREVGDVKKHQALLKTRCEKEDAKTTESLQSMFWESSQTRLSDASHPKQQDGVGHETTVTYSPPRRSCDMVGSLFTNSSR